MSPSEKVGEKLAACICKDKCHEKDKRVFGKTKQQKMNVLFGFSMFLKPEVEPNVELTQPW